MMHIVKVGALLIFSVPFDHIFNAQEQVGYGRCLLVAVTVVGILGAVAQSLHKFRHPNIGGAGKGGNAVVAIDSAVIQGLGVGGFRTVEEGVILPVIDHIADHGSGILRALGIIGHHRD